MKTKSILLSTLFAVFTLSALAQLKVNEYGRVGIGTVWPSPGYKCHVAGDLLLSSYPATPFYELQFKVSPGWAGTEIGTNSDKIAFWSPWVEYHDVYADNFHTLSDIRLKSNISEITFGIKKIMKIRPVYYTMINNNFDSIGTKNEGTRQQYGFISQEIEKSFPEVKITDDVHGYKLMDYNQIIPITVAAIQEQQKIIDSLKNELTLIKEQIKSDYLLNTNNNITFNEQNQSILNQNTPNPFNQKTEIKFKINEQNFRNASIVIFDLNGLMIKTYEIQKAGDGSIEINEYELKAGMYIYTLIVNQREIDSKRMILLN